MARRHSRRTAHAHNRRLKSTHHRAKQPKDTHVHHGHTTRTVNAPKHW